MDEVSVPGGGPSSGGSAPAGKHRAVRLPPRQFSGEALMAWATVSTILGGFVTVLSLPAGTAIMYVGAVVGGAGLVRDERARRR